MKFSKLHKVLVGLSLLTLSCVALASNKGPLQISNPVIVNGKELPAGDYSLKWEGTGQDVQVSIMKDKKVVTTVPAHLIQLNDSAISDSAVIRKSDTGNGSLSQVRFGGKKYALSFEDVTSQSQSVQGNQ